MTTLSELAERFGYFDLGVALLEVEIPVLTGLQRQGDILVVPWQPTEQPSDDWLEKLDGVEVTFAITGHTHTLHGEGQWFGWETSDDGLRWLARQFHADNLVDDLNFLHGVLRVPSGGAAYLMHSDEHGALGIGPGWYQVRGQLQYAEQSWTDVED